MMIATAMRAARESGIALLMFARHPPGIGGNSIDSHVHSDKIPSAPTRTMSASYCSGGPNSRPQLFMKPFVSRFISESGMPCHEIRKGLDLTRRFDDAHTSHGRSELCQSAWHGENQVSLRDGKDRGHKEWQSERDLPLCAKLGTERDPLKPRGAPARPHGAAPGDADSTVG